MKGRNRQTDAYSLFSGMYPPKPTTVEAGRDPSQELGTASRTIMWVAGTQALEPSPAASQGSRQQEAGKLMDLHGHVSVTLVTPSARFTARLSLGAEHSLSGVGRMGNDMNPSLERHPALFPHSLSHLHSVSAVPTLPSQGPGTQSWCTGSGDEGSTLSAPLGTRHRHTTSLRPVDLSTGPRGQGPARSLPSHLLGCGQDLELRRQDKGQLEWRAKLPLGTPHGRGHMVMSKALLHTRTPPRTLQSSHPS